MDNISKAIFTVIGVALCVIALKLYNPHSPTPTHGDLRAVVEMKDPERQKEACIMLINSIPLVRVGDVDVSGIVSINGDVWQQVS